MDATKETAAKTGRPFGVGVKLNTSDLSLEGGLTEPEAMEIVRELAKLGPDFVELSGGSYEVRRLRLDPFEAQKQKSLTIPSTQDGVMLAGPPEYAKESTKRREAFFLHFSSQARQAIRQVSKDTNKPLSIIVTGGFKTRKGMAIAVKTNDCEFVGLGRSICVEADLPGRMLRGEVDKCVDVWNVSWGLGDYLFPLGRAWTWWVVLRPRRTILLQVVGGNRSRETPTIFLPRFQIQLHYIAQRKYWLLNKPVDLFPWGAGIIFRDVYFDPQKFWIARKFWYGMD